MKASKLSVQASTHERDNSAPDFSLYGNPLSPLQIPSLRQNAQSHGSCAAYVPGRYCESACPENLAIAPTSFVLRRIIEVAW